LLDHAVSYSYDDEAGGYDERPQLDANVGVSIGKLKHDSPSSDLHSQYIVILWH
jgi:hypothetical protein